MRHVSLGEALRVRGSKQQQFLLRCALVLASGALAWAPAAAAAETATAPEAVLGSAAASGSTPGGPVGPTANGPSAALEQCATSGAQAERSATFLGEMTATAGTGRMSMRIELQERLPGEATFHTVAAPGLGVWRAAAPGVKVYRYIKQVTNLSAPAVYRAAVRFRWLNTKGKLIRGVERRTSTCAQPARPAGPSAPTPTVAG
ncbi:MAG TPA: hypothetical protein VGO14_01135 [Solirubrobacteraceae bacterium]|jgi:hypothetical protein|nr:hypothetical protein [Solirubrobacteraceae bacterium]